MHSFTVGLWAREASGRETFRNRAGVISTEAYELRFASKCNDIESSDHPNGFGVECLTDEKDGPEVWAEVARLTFVRKRSFWKALLDTPGTHVSTTLRARFDCVRAEMAEWTIKSQDELEDLLAQFGRECRNIGGHLRRGAGHSPRGFGRQGLRW